jgi:hypothetical protein
LSNARQTILPLYSKRPVDSGRWQRTFNILSRILLAAGYGVLVVILPPTMLYLLALPIIAMLLITLWMLPDRATFPLGAIETVFPIYIVLNNFWPIYIAISLPGLPWLTPTRIVLFVQTFLLVLSFSTSRELRQHIGNVVKGSSWFWISFLVWEAMQLITLPLAENVGYCLKIFTDNQLSMAGVLFISCVLFTKRGWANWVANAVIVMAIIISLDGFVELHLGYPPWAYHIPSFMRVDEGIMNTVLGSQSRTADGLYRVHGPFTLSLVFAEFLALCTPFIVHAIVTKRGVIQRALLFLALVLVIAAIVVSQSRLGLVGVMIAFMLYPLIWAYRIWRSGRGGMLGPALLFAAPAAVMLMLAVVLSSHTMTTRVFGGGAQAASDESRREQLQMAWPKVLHNPIGYGLNSSGGVLGFTNPAGYVTIDNGWISMLLDLGVPGAIAFLSLLLATIRQGVLVYLRTNESELSLAGPATIAVVIFVVIRWVLSQDNNFPFEFMLIAMILGLRARSIASFHSALIDSEHNDQQTGGMASLTAIPNGAGTYKMRR